MLSVSFACFSLRPRFNTIHIILFPAPSSSPVLRFFPPELHLHGGIPPPSILQHMPRTWLRLSRAYAQGRYQGADTSMLGFGRGTYKARRKVNVRFVDMVLGVHRGPKEPYDRRPHGMSCALSYLQQPLPLPE